MLKRGHSNQIAEAAQDAALGYIAPSKELPSQTSERFQFTLTPSVQQTGSSSGTSSGNSYGSTNNSQNNTYTPGQSALENAITGGYSNLLGGNIPSSFTQNPQLINAYNQNFNQTTNPSIASTLGPGSPQMQSNYAQGLTSLLANQYNTGVSNYENALGGATSNALNPVGTSGGTNAVGGGTTNQSGNFSGTMSQPLNLAALLGGGGQILQQLGL